MKIADIIITTLLKRGAICELKNFKTEIDIPGVSEGEEPKRLIVTAESLQIRLNREDK